MQISEIRQTSSERYTIVFEDESELRSTLKVITDHRIYSGMDLDDDDYARLVDDSSYSLCEAHAVKLLSYQPLSKKGLEKMMKPIPKWWFATMRQRDTVPNGSKANCTATEFPKSSGRML